MTRRPPSPPQGGQTRYSPPAPGEGHLVRPELTAHLQRNVARERVSMVCAPSGFGKTSAVNQWARTTRMPVAWLTLSRFDSDPVRATSGILEALRLCAHAQGHDPSSTLFSVVAEHGDDSAAFDAVRNAFSDPDHPIVLVIDDAHRAGDGIGSGVLGALIESGPPGLHLLLVGGTLLELALSRLLLTRPDCCTGVESLAFTPQEVEELAGAASADAGLIHVRTAGWPIAVRLLLLGGTPAVSLPGDDRVLRAYIDAHVLKALPSDLAAFVLDACTVAELTAPIAALLTDRPDAAQLLAECARVGLFLDTFDSPDGRVYRWHQLFAQQCRALAAQRDPRRVGERHRRAAGALADSDPLVAAEHWIAAGEPRGALELMLVRWVRLLVHGEAASVDRTLSRLPDGLNQSPSCLLVRACAQEVMGAHALARALHAKALSTAADGPRSDLKCNGSGCGW